MIGELYRALKGIFSNKPAHEMPSDYSDMYTLYQLGCELGSLKVGMLRICTKDYAQDVKSREDVLEQTVKNSKPDILVGPEYMFSTSPPLTKEKKDEVVEDLKRMSRDEDMLMIPGSIIWQDEEDGRKTLANASPVMYKGEVILEYVKKAEGGEGAMAKSFGLEKRLGTGKGMFSWKGYKCGIEICVDHGSLVADGATDLDLHFLVSCGVWPYDSCIATREGGYLLYCDGFYPKTNVLKKKPQMFDYVEPVKKHDA